jgi:hypothetical protein
VRYNVELGGCGHDEQMLSAAETAALAEQVRALIKRCRSGEITATPGMAYSSKVL